MWGTLYTQLHILQASALCLLARNQLQSSTGEKHVISEKSELLLTPIQVTVSLPQETKSSVYEASKI